MNSYLTKAGLLILGMLVIWLSPQETTAREELPIPITDAEWIAAETPAAAGDETQSIGTPGVHASGGEPSVSGQKGSMPVFRKSFILDDAAISHAQVAVCGLGHFELSVNGEKVGDHFLDPPWSDYAETCYYVRFDVAELLKPGENVLGVMLGNGMYNVRGGRYTKFLGSFGPPKLTLCLVVSQGDKQLIISSDATWKTDAGPIAFSCIYGGEDHDARREQPGWDKPGFDDGHWKPVKGVDGPGGKLLPATSPPIKVVRHLEPVSITKLKDDRYEVDLGENLSARPVIKVKGKKGSRVTIETAERKGKPWPGHVYTYTLKGDKVPEFFAPRFSYFGFQYLYVNGVVWGDDVSSAHELPKLVDVGADFVSSCGPRIGAFACGNSLFNEIDNMIDRSVASNLQHVLTDCPHREKLGWLEVAHLMGPSILFHYDMGELYRKICRDTTDSQLENGLVPDIAPEFVRFKDGFFESPEWGSASVQIPWLIHQWYGDERILRDQYPTMARYTDYLADSRDAAGLVKGGLGDWYDWTPDKGHVGHSQLTPKELPAMCMLYDNARILRQAATMQGKADEARKWEGLMEEVRHDFLAAYYDTKNKAVATGSQCALALGLYFGLVPDEDRAAVLANLVQNLETNQYRPSTGEVSFRYLVLALAEAGRSDVVYRMIDRTDPPGYGCMLKQHGLKTLSERWDRPGSSLNHCMFGHIQEWFQKYLLGIRQAPGSTGYEKVLIDPFIPDNLEWAKGSFDSPNGLIEVAWVRKGATVEVTVQAEEANIIVPPGRTNIQWKIHAGGKKGTQSPVVNLLPNPSFEEKEDDGAQGWTSRAWAGKENAQWSVEAPGHTGKHCISISSATGADTAWTTTVAVKQNAWYRLSGWIKTREVRGAVGALLNIQNMQAVKTSPVFGTREWTRVSTIFQAAATELEINCLFGGWGKSTGKACYDDVTLEPVDNPPNETRATVTINSGARSISYSPMIFGGFLEHFGRQIYGGVFEPGSPLSDQDGFRLDVIDALKELKTPVVRWPGGCYVSGYHWEKGVGMDRKPTDDMAWGVIEPNTFGTDEFVKLCRLIGWQPYICNNAGNGTVEEMREWIEYCNGRTGKYAQMRRDNGHAEPQNVGIWSIGNENWGRHEIGYKPIEQWAPLVLKAAQAMKAADPKIQLSAAALPSREWTLPLLKLAGPYLDYISIHSYWLPLWQNNDMPDYLTCIMNSQGPEETIGRFIGVLEESGYRGRIKIAFDEWNLRSWHHPGFPRKTVQDYADPEVAKLVKAREKSDIASQYTMADALFSASFFNACLRHAEDVGMANIAPIVNTRGPLFVHPKGIVKRTHFHTMAMYANELEARVGELHLEGGNLRHGNRSVPVIDAIATVDKAGQQWAIALVNRHPSEKVACTLKMGEMPFDGKYKATILTGESPDSYNDIQHPDRVAPEKIELTFKNGLVDLPPHSLTIVHLTVN